LADDALESAAPEGIVQRHGNSDGRRVGSQLHDAVASALTHIEKSVRFEDLAGFGA